MTGVNIPLLRKAVEWAEAEAAKPYWLREWRQAMWVTTFDDAEREAWGPIASLTTHQSLGKAKECGTCYCIAGYVVSQLEGPTPNVVTRAMELLGMTYSQASELFESNNTIEDVRRIAEEIAGERL